MLLDMLVCEPCSNTKNSDEEQGLDSKSRVLGGDDLTSAAIQDRFALFEA